MTGGRAFTPVIFQLRGLVVQTRQQIGQAPIYVTFDVPFLAGRRRSVYQHKDVAGGGVGPHVAEDSPVVMYS